MLRQLRQPRSPFYIAVTISKCRGHLLAGKLVSTRVALICRSSAATKCMPAIRTRRSSRLWIAWTACFGREP